MGPIGTALELPYDTAKVQLQVAGPKGNLEVPQELCETMRSEHNQGPETVSVEQQDSWMKRAADDPQPQTSHA
jgi:hypothetical protein